jgi:hypothetical protein
VSRTPPPPDHLIGYVDLHTHPLSNVGFGGKLLYGGVDIGALLPADPDCNQNARAMSMQQALGHDASTHGLWNPFTNPCGDTVRAGVIQVLQLATNSAQVGPDALGAPSFHEWPVWNDVTHQKMWVDWIRRAFDSGLRVMVALTVNNKTLADATSGPCDYPTDDKNSTDLQLAEIKPSLVVIRNSWGLRLRPTILRVSSGATSSRSSWAKKLISWATSTKFRNLRRNSRSPRRSTGFTRKVFDMYFQSTSSTTLRGGTAATRTCLTFPLFERMESTGNSPVHHRAPIHQKPSTTISRQGQPSMLRTQLGKIQTKYNLPESACLSLVLAGTHGCTAKLFCNVAPDSAEHGV